MEEKEKRNNDENEEAHSSIYTSLYQPYMLLCFVIPAFIILMLLIVPILMPLLTSSFIFLNAVYFNSSIEFFMALFTAIILAFVCSALLSTALIWLLLSSLNIFIGRYFHNREKQ
jgi:hypothetical protein